MVLYQTGDKALPEQMMTQFIGANMHYQTSVS